MSLPKDPIMLYSAVNMKLRDQYSSLDDLCASESIDKTELVEKLRSVGFEYNSELNQFR